MSDYINSIKFPAKRRYFGYGCRRRRIRRTFKKENLLLMRLFGFSLFELDCPNTPPRWRLRCRPTSSVFLSRISWISNQMLFPYFEHRRFAGLSCRPLTFLRIPSPQIFTPPKPLSFVGARLPLSSVNHLKIKCLFTDFLQFNRWLFLPLVPYFSLVYRQFEKRDRDRLVDDQMNTDNHFGLTNSVRKCNRKQRPRRFSAL